ncbi:WD40 repeat-like protein [Martensiomyces pterosporus]|nr:WD40 repeat-like protein [Martensiomyces pterosporus]
MNSFQVQPVARKITAARWLLPRAGSAYTDTDLYFVTGSSAKHKELVLWTTPNPDFFDPEGLANDSNNSSTELAALVAKVTHDGDVHDIAVPSPGLLATASSFGTISIYYVDHDTDTETPLALREAVTAHRYANSEPAVCTALAAQPTSSADVEIASCGEDGRIAYAPLSRMDTLQTHEVDSTVITGICWPTPAQLAVSTRAGQIKLFDRRNPSTVSAVFVDPSSSASFECIAAHPSQSFRIATGTDSGSVLMWDVRNAKKPVMEAFNVHEANVWEVQFHPTDGSKVVSCSDDASMAVTEWARGKSSAAEPHSVRHLSSIFNALSISCFDICPFTRTSLMVAGSDSDNILMERTASTEFSLF